jgi:hypothetical protein
LVNTSVQIGGAVMLAVISAVIGAGSGGTEKDALLPGMTSAIQVVVALTVVGLIGTLTLIGFRRTPAVDAEPVPVGPQLAECAAC